MKLILEIVTLALVTLDPMAQFSGHKSEAEIARMTPQQRVEEYCREYVRHGVSDDDYRQLLDRYLSQDGLRAVPHLGKIIDEYDPMQGEGESKEKSERFDAAWILLSDMDETVIRLRASREGQIGIDAMRQLIERMKAAHFDTTDPAQYDKQRRYKLCLAALKTMEGINRCDEAIGATLRLKYKISLSNHELLDFVNYLVSTVPHYPAWSGSEEFKDLTQHNEAGNPLWYLTMKNPEPFHQAYLTYKANSK